MAILFAGTEDESFILTTAAQHFARSEEDHDFVTSGHGLALSSTALNTTPVLSQQTEIWVSVMVAHVVSNSSNTQPFLQLYDSVNAKVFLQLDMDANSTVSMEYWNGAAYIEQPGLFPVDTSFAENAIHRYTLHAKLHDTTGVFECYIDDVLAYKLSGDTLLGGYANFDQVILGAANSGTGTGAGTTFSELIVSTTPTWGQRVFSHLVTGAGTNTAWTNGATEVDDVAVANDADSITDDVNGDVETYANTNLATEPNRMIPSCVITAFRGQNSGAGSANNIQHTIRSGGTDYFSSSVTGLSTTLAPYQNIWTTDPNTAAAWTNSNIDAMEVGVKAVT